MQTQDPLGGVDRFMMSVITAALSLSAAISLIGREWHELVGHSPYLEGVVGTAAGILFVLAAGRFRR